MDVGKLFIKLRKRFAGQYTGQFRSIFKWSGVEIVDSRKYVAGDAQKFINRKQSAKHNDLYVSLLEQDRDVQVDILCDVNYNWQGSRTIFAYLDDLVVFARSQHMSLSVYYSQDNTLRMQPLRHDQDRYALEYDLQQIASAQSPRYRSSLSLLIDRAMQQKKRRVLLFVSDFLEVSDNDRERLHLLSRDYQVALVRVGISQWEGINYIGSFLKKYNWLDRLFVDVV